MKKWFSQLSAALVVMIAFAILNALFNSPFPDFFVGWVSCMAYYIVGMALTDSKEDDSQSI